MWRAYWGLERDPFPEEGGLQVALPGQEEALARLVHLVEAGQRWAVLSGPPGCGKTRVLRRAAARWRSPLRRTALVADPIDGHALFAGLAESLGARRPVGVSRESAWRALELAVRRCAVQDQQVVLGVDGVSALGHGLDRTDLHRLGALGAARGIRLSVIAVAGEERPAEEDCAPAGCLTVRLRPLLLSEARQYLEEKLAAAGCDATLFSPRAITRLHLLSGGIPRRLDRLASQCLMAGASRHHEAISSELVDSLAAEIQAATWAPRRSGWNCGSESC